MHNNSLLEILRTLSKDEFKRFDKFVTSPYFNKKSYVISLFRHIRKYYPDFKSQKLDREQAWKAIYPVKKYNYGIFKNLVFDLTKLAENFLKIEYYLKDELQSGYNFLDVLNERHLTKLFKSNFNVISKSAADLYARKVLSAENYFEFMSKLYLLKFGFSAEFSPYPGMDKELITHLESLISYFMIVLIKADLSYLSFKADNNPKQENNLTSIFLDKVDLIKLMEYYETKSSLSFNVLNAYYKMYLSINDKNSPHKYFDFKKTLEFTSPGLSNSDKHILLSSLTNCVANLTAYGINKSSESLEIAKLQINEKVLLNHDGYIGVTHFISLIQSACNVGDHIFIEEFTNKFSRYLHSDVKENLEKFSLVHYHFARKEYNKSLELILKIDYDLFTMKYYLKNLQMMNFYELSDYESYLSNLDSIRHFISKNKSITEKWKVSQTLFVNYLSALFKLRENPDEFELKKLKADIQNSNPQKKQWLIGKTDELIQHLLDQGF